MEDPVWFAQFTTMKVNVDIIIHSVVVGRPLFLRFLKINSVALLFYGLT